MVLMDVGWRPGWGWYHTRSPNSVLPIFGIPVPILAAQDFSGLTNFESSFPRRLGHQWAREDGPVGFSRVREAPQAEWRVGCESQPHYPAPFQVAHLL